eukprot:1161540-Pelagomonas_calceolata.AAC.15
MKVTVPDQKLPVTFTLLARVTTTDLIFTPAKLDFGPCVVGEATVGHVSWVLGYACGRNYVCAWASGLKLVSWTSGNAEWEKEALARHTLQAVCGGKRPRVAVHILHSNIGVPAHKLVSASAREDFVCAFLASSLCFALCVTLFPAMPAETCPWCPIPFWHSIRIMAKTTQGVSVESNTPAHCSKPCGAHSGSWQTFQVLSSGSGTPAPCPKHLAVQTYQLALASFQTMALDTSCQGAKRSEIIWPGLHIQRIALSCAHSYGLSRVQAKSAQQGGLATDENAPGTLLINFPLTSLPMHKEGSAGQIYLIY